jgi:general stress protein CsbA
MNYYKEYNKYQSKVILPFIVLVLFTLVLVVASTYLEYHENPPTWFWWIIGVTIAHNLFKIVEALEYIIGSQDEMWYIHHDFDKYCKLYTEGIIYEQT